MPALRARRPAAPVSEIVPVAPVAPGASCRTCEMRLAEIKHLRGVLEDAKAELVRLAAGDKIEDVIEREIRRQIISVRQVGGEYENLNVSKILETGVKFLAAKNKVTLPATPYGSALGGGRGGEE